MARVPSYDIGNGAQAGSLPLAANTPAADPNTFGAQVGSEIGAAGDAAGRIAQFARERMTEAASSDASASFLQQAEQMTLGPQGYTAKTGKDALVAHDAFKQGLQDLYTATYKGLPNAQAQAQFQNSAMRNYRVYVNTADNHFVSEAKKVHSQAQQTLINTNTLAAPALAIQAKDWNDEVKGQIDSLMDEAESKTRAIYKADDVTEDSETADDAVKRVRGAIATSVVEGLMRAKTPGKAGLAYKAYEDTIPDAVKGPTLSTLAGMFKDQGAAGLAADVVRSVPTLNKSDPDGPLNRVELDKAIRKAGEAMPDANDYFAFRKKAIALADEQDKAAKEMAASRYNNWQTTGDPVDKAWLERNAHSYITKETLLQEKVLKGGLATEAAVLKKNNDAAMTQLSVTMLNDLRDGTLDDKSPMLYSSESGAQGPGVAQTLAYASKFKNDAKDPNKAKLLIKIPAHINNALAAAEGIQGDPQRMSKYRGPLTDAYVKEWNRTPDHGMFKDHETDDTFISKWLIKQLRVIRGK